jgi:hypothetical protein
LSDLGGIPLQHDWPGWWSKIEALTLKGPCLYLDLDTVVLDSLKPLLKIAETRPFTVLRDFNHPNAGHEVQSSVMAWNGNLGRLYTRFRCHPEYHMEQNSCREYWGDQGYIERHAEGWEFWQDLLPGALVSYKLQCRDGVPPGARVLVFHGKPRPWDVKEYETPLHLAERSQSSGHS